MEARNSPRKGWFGLGSNVLLYVPYNIITTTRYFILLVWRLSWDVGKVSRSLQKCDPMPSTD